MEKLKKSFNDQNIIFLCSFVVSLVITILFSSALSWITCASVVSGILSSMFTAKGKWICFIFDIISYGTYIYICALAHYYGEIILSCIVILIFSIGLFQWKKNEKDNKVIINALYKKEIIASIAVTLVILIAYSLSLYFIGSSLPILNGLCTVSFLLGSFWSMRRSILQYVGYISYEVFMITIWLVDLISGNPSNTMLLIGAMTEAYFLISGVIEWKKLKETQKENKIIKNKKGNNEVNPIFATAKKRTLY